MDACCSNMIDFIREIIPRSAKDFHIVGDNIEKLNMQVLTQSNAFNDSIDKIMSPNK